MCFLFQVTQQMKELRGVGSTQQGLQLRGGLDLLQTLNSEKEGLTGEVDLATHRAGGREHSS